MFLIRERFNYYKWRLLNPIIPCAVCKIPACLPICKGCQAEIEKSTSPYCQYCAKPGDIICKDCKNNPPVFSHTYCLYTYSTPLNKMLHQLKYKSNKSSIWALGFLLKQTLSNVKKDTDYIVPMPLSKRRYQQRGFNQVEYLLHYYQATTGDIKVKNQLVKKVEETPHQTSLTREQRQQIETRYKVEKDVKNKNILIVDDVITTGSTANKLALALKLAGAKRVELCALMRTVSQ